MAGMPRHALLRRAETSFRMRKEAGGAAWQNPMEPRSRSAPQPWTPLNAFLLDAPIDIFWKPARDGIPASPPFLVGWGMEGSRGFRLSLECRYSSCQRRGDVQFRDPADDISSSELPGGWGGILDRLFLGRYHFRCQVGGEEAPGNTPRRRASVDRCLSLYDRHRDDNLECPPPRLGASEANLLWAQYRVVRTCPPTTSDRWRSE